MSLRPQQSVHTPAFLVPSRGHEETAALPYMGSSAKIKKLEEQLAKVNEELSKTKKDLYETIRDRQADDDNAKRRDTTLKRRIAELEKKLELEGSRPNFFNEYLDANYMLLEAKQTAIHSLVYSGNSITNEDNKVVEVFTLPKHVWWPFPVDGKPRASGMDGYLAFDAYVNDKHLIFEHYSRAVGRTIRVSRRSPEEEWPVKFEKEGDTPFTNATIISKYLKQRDN